MHNIVLGDVSVSIDGNPGGDQARITVPGVGSTWASASELRDLRDLLTALLDDAPTADSGNGEYVNESDRWTLLNALFTAADVVDEHAETCRKIAAQLREGHEAPGLFAPGENGARGAERIAGAHAETARVYRRMRDRIENASTLTIH